MRVWRALQINKRSGKYHGMQLLMKDASESFLCLKCPACPQPGFNMEWRVEVSDADR